jgi:hemerythrin
MEKGGAMDFFVWNEKFNTGVETIDSQHKKLVSIINALNNAVHESHAGPAIGGIISELEDYTRYHFSEEERILDSYESEDLEPQRRQHEFFTGEIARMKKTFQEGKFGGSSQSLLSFLRDWLVNHILDQDKKIGMLVRPS